MLRLLFIFTFTSAFLIAGAQEASRKPYKSSRKLVKKHICVECIGADGLPGLPDIKNSKYEMEIRWLSRGHAGTETALAITRQNNRYEAHLYFLSGTFIRQLYPASVASPVRELPKNTSV